MATTLRHRRIVTAVVTALALLTTVAPTAIAPWDADPGSPPPFLAVVLGAAFVVTVATLAASTILRR